MASDFLLEIGMEEMPARFVTNAMNQLKDTVTQWLEEKRIGYTSVEAFSTPRRLSVRINEIASKQEDITEEARGPSKKIAVDENGEWTKAAQGFAKGQGVELGSLYFKEQKGSEYVFAKKEISGRETAELLTEMKSLITAMHFPKNMRWGSFSLKYVRPIHWIVALYDEEVIPFEIAGVRTGKESKGHRFLGNDTEITHPNKYESILEKEYIIVHPEVRKAEIQKQIKELAGEQRWSIPVNESLLEEVNNLVEYPTVLYGTFSKDFLKLPEEVLVTSMREHQRYFPVESEEGDLLPYFVTVRNGNREYIENVRKGNEKVLRARLSDAQFFYEEDQKLKPDEAVKKLDSIVFQEDLGTIGDKVRRLQSLVVTFANKLTFHPQAIRDVERAAQLSKFDLVTLMVDEFTELQGLMGEKYALLAGEDVDAATAIKEHYQPKSSGDSVPATPIGAVLALADKLDTITSCFGIGLIPTGSQDPYGLRRQAAGIVQILLEHEYKLTLEELIDETIAVLSKADLLKKTPEAVKKEVLAFFSARLKNNIMDRDIRYDIADSVLEDVTGQAQVLAGKAEFLQQKLNDDDFKDTVEALSRVTNIAKGNEKAAIPIEVSLFEEQPEKELYEAYNKVKTELPQSLEQGNIEEAWRYLVEIKPIIHKYFDHVMVMADNERIKENRLNQMKLLSKEIRRFANFQYIVFSS